MSIYLNRVDLICKIRSRGRTHVYVYTVIYYAVHGMVMRLHHRGWLHFGAILGGDREFRDRRDPVAGQPRRERRDDGSTAAEESNGGAMAVAQRQSETRQQDGRSSRAADHLTRSERIRAARSAIPRRRKAAPGKPRPLRQSHRPPPRRATVAPLPWLNGRADAPPGRPYIASGDASGAI